MRKLTEKEIDFALDDNGESSDGFEAIEATVEELSELGVETSCGHHGNNPFEALLEDEYGKALCRGWYRDDNNKREVCGMFHIKLDTDEVAEYVERLVASAGGSMRYSGPSLWEGYKEFEIE